MNCEIYMNYDARREYEVRLHIGLGPIDLGMPREQVRSKIGVMPMVVSRMTLKFPMDFFREAALQVEYGSDSRCISIQATSRATVWFRENRLIGAPFEKMRSWFEAMDPAVSVDGAGLTSHALGIGLYAESALKNPELPVEAVIVFVQGYYEKAAAGEI
jgi:hypothetical protein